MTTDYARALTVAAEAARAAGALLRDEFHRLAGEAADPDHAEVDAVAERLIRERLLAAFPDYAYLGEETGASPPPSGQPSPHIWLVDPNDGTKAYQEGYRGGTVSIALLRDGLPVLGVVYAALAPDDDGDGFAWAEGQGPLRRNGLPVALPVWPRALGRHDVVLTSYSADRATEANLRCVAPARFIAVPSIAYRLGLVAAGEAVATSALSGPCSWDLAGGHALLRAAGGELVDEQGRPIRYGMDGRGAVRWAFGGAPAVLPELVHRPWADVFHRHSTPTVPPTPFPLDPIRPRPGLAIADAAILRRAQGCLLGQVAGDALGSLVEFQSTAEIARRYPDGVRRLADGGTWNTTAGQPTDDSELALMLARAIVHARRPDPEVAARAYGWWYRSAPFDLGTTTRVALGAIASADPSRDRLVEIARQAAVRDSQANGSLMRISPIGVWGALAPVDAVAAAARADSALTHPHPVCQEACATFAVAIAHAIRTGDGPRAAYEWTLEWMRRNGREPAVQRALEAAAAAPPSSFQRQAGWVLVAFQNAFHRLLRAPSIEEGVAATTMAGGDADTNCAIAGALLGAVHGRAAVPTQWRSLLLSCRPAVSLPGIAHPRPRPCWPVDLLSLAEQLLVLGERVMSDE
ncbi:MAG: ADP-ribosylglycohydrolase family protein [Chloroflexi bacterium]|nr:ADP-ribosylglycohydrolase family protein [Chloroflexota bacterium]